MCYTFSFDHVACGDVGQLVESSEDKEERWESRRQADKHHVPMLKVAGVGESPVDSAPPQRDRVIEWIDETEKNLGLQTLLQRRSVLRWVEASSGEAELC